MEKDVVNYMKLKLGFAKKIIVVYMKHNHQIMTANKMARDDKRMLELLQILLLNGKSNNRNLLKNAYKKLYPIVQIRILRKLPDFYHKRSPPLSFFEEYLAKALDQELLLTRVPLQIKERALRPCGVF
ncbi:hypothetical protein ACJJTC_003156 [Scirpophaga incertulas]